MNEYDRQARISQLHSRRHALLLQRGMRDTFIASIDMELNVVRSELQALYGIGRVEQRTPKPRNAASHAQIA